MEILSRFFYWFLREKSLFLRFSQKIWTQFFDIFLENSLRKRCKASWKKLTLYNSMCLHLLFPMVKTTALYLAPIKSYSKNTHVPFILKWPTVIFKKISARSDEPLRRKRRKLLDFAQKSDF